VTGDGEVGDLAEKREEHEPAPKDGEGYYRFGVLKGYAPGYQPRELDYPLTCICTCGKTIDQEAPGKPWVYRW
jgi:hypothetical protein